MFSLPPAVLFVIAEDPGDDVGDELTTGDHEDIGGDETTAHVGRRWLGDVHRYGRRREPCGANKVFLLYLFIIFLF